MAGMFDKETLRNAKISEAEKELDEALAAERPDELGAKLAAKEANTEVKETPEAAKEEVPEVVDGVNWKQRYGNLQRYIDKSLKPDFEGKIKGLSATVEQLQTQLESFKKSAAPAELPTSIEEVEALKKENPAAYAAISAIAQGIADKIVSDKVKGLEGQMLEINTRQKQTAEEAAFVALQRRHKDLDLVALNDDPDFHEWLNGKPKIFQAALRENKTDIDAADEVIKLYKLEHGVGKKQAKAEKSSLADAGAKAVSVKSGKPDVSVDSGGYEFSESQIERMSSKEFEKNADKIAKAQQEGRIFPDLTDPVKAAQLSQAARRAA